MAVENIGGHGMASGMCSWLLHRKGRVCSLHSCATNQKFPGHVLRMNKKKWETLVGESMQVLRMDRAGEQTGEKMQEFARANGIVLSYTSPNSSAGAAEAFIQIL